MKVNANKCIVGLNYILYLGFIINKYWIKPDMIKVQGIMDIVKPSTTTELQAIIGMFK